MWYEHMKSFLPECVRIVGRVIGQVYIKDINREVGYNSSIDISVIEANRSNDLTNAISKGWVSVIHGNELLKPKPVSNDVRFDPPQDQSRPQTNLNDLKGYILQATQQAVSSSMAAILSELKSLQVNNVSNINIDEKTVKNIVGQIVDKLPMNGKKIELSESNNVFINLDDNRELKTNINGIIGTETIKKDDKAKSITKKLKSIKGE